MTRPPTDHRPNAPRVVSGLGDSPAGGPAHGSDHGERLDLDPRTYDRALDCVHCGLCLPACPTYTTTALEADSPRGRIMLMKGLADGRLTPTASVVRHLDLCLDCRACETACPSGVVYHELIEETRHRLAAHPSAERRRSLTDRLVEAMFFHVFTRPARLKLALLPVRLLQRLGLGSVIARLPLPPKLAKMRDMLPPPASRGIRGLRGQPRIPGQESPPGAPSQVPPPPLWESPMLERYPADPAATLDGKPRVTVGFFTGCVSGVLQQELNRRAVRVLTRLGCEVRVPRAQNCCGAIHHHGGRPHDAARMARRNIEAFAAAGVTRVVSAVAGCGAMLVEYDHLLRDDPSLRGRAAAFAAGVRDISELLVELCPEPPVLRHALDVTVAYHDACHLRHAQGVYDAPRTVLSWVPGLRVVPLPEEDMCCGAAGTYNLSEPEMSLSLGRRKLSHLGSTGARVCVTANIGCAMQIQSLARAAGLELRVLHPVWLLHDALFGTGDPAAGPDR